MRKTIVAALLVLAITDPAYAKAVRAPSGVWVIQKFASGYEEFWASSQGMDPVVALGEGWCGDCPGYAVGLFYVNPSPWANSAMQVMTQDADFDGEELTFRTSFTIPVLGFLSVTNYRLVFSPGGKVATGDYIETVYTYFGPSEFYGDLLARKDGELRIRR